MARGDLVEIGAHTLTHTALPMLPIGSQKEEITASKTRLEKLLGRPVTSFSYPYGHLSPETVAAIREAGFEYACSTVEEVAGSSADPFQLPRIMVTDRDGERFARLLARWLGD